MSRRRSQSTRWSVRYVSNDRRREEVPRSTTHCPKAKKNPSTKLAKGSRQPRPSRPRSLPIHSMDIATHHSSTRASSPKLKAADRSNINRGYSADMSYQITDLSLFPVAKCSSIVTAVVHCHESTMCPNSTDLSRRVVGSKGRTVRVTQLSPGSWLLVGCRYDDDLSSRFDRQSATLFDADEKNSLQNDADSHDGDHLSDGDEEVEEAQGGYESHTGPNGGRLDRDRIRSSKRSHVP
ncbi:hypothetical protein K458DRAFT_102510 [Lentithecium fluviatile CBS 122367]|uniref:Uncharacterized protein n=1 Tax=Lentithecium fluviatile CBS 122367 TaxID=1168545 RepID=A0A6G1JIL0_9PLEO|nr:hypothetical protein K458DRAFT_102510 [Lentithecium fluviatile CBS 122367]